MTITYPVGPVTPHGEYYLMKGILPEVTLKAYDDSIHFFVMGGKSIPDKVNAPESVQLEDIKGLIPPWQHIDQKAATQDGVTNIDTLYDPIEVALTVACRGKTPQRTRQVVRDLIASIDAKQQSELSWWTLDGGYWWAPVRWFKGAPDDALMTVPQCRQRLSLRLRADNGFWRTYDDAGMRTTSGFLARSNIGDQPMYDDYTVFGPGTFRFADGPGSTDMIEFGPLLPNQIAFLRTDPRKRSVQDLTVIPPTPQELTTFQTALSQLLSFATGNNIPPLLQAIESFFGIRPPQGNMYSLLKGRWSDNAAIPPKSPGAPATPYYVKVEITGGNSDSKVIASGVPLRRWPL